MVVVVIETPLELTIGAVTDDDAHGGVHGEEGVGVGVVEEGGYDVAVVEMEVEGTGGVATVGGRVRWAEFRPVSATVEGDHGDVVRVWEGEG